MNQDMFGHLIKDGDTVFYVTSSRYGCKRVGKVFSQTDGELHMMASTYYKNQKHISVTKSTYWAAKAIVVQIPKEIEDQLDKAYLEWRVKNGKKEF